MPKSTSKINHLCNEMNSYKATMMETEQEKLDILTQWALDHGSHIENITLKVKVMETEDNEDENNHINNLDTRKPIFYRGGFVSANEIKLQEVICSIPDEICLTETRSRQSVIGEKLSEFLESEETTSCKTKIEKENIDKPKKKDKIRKKEWETNNPMDSHAEGVLYMIAFMIQEYGKGTKSFWFPYLNALPESFPTIPLCWPKQVRHILLMGTNLGFLIEKRIELLQSGYDILKELSQEIKEKLDHMSKKSQDENNNNDKDSGMNEIYRQEEDLKSFVDNLSWSKFLWAFCSISSRAFPKLQANLTNATQRPKISEEQGIEEVPMFNELCLYPFLDMLNHKRKQPIEWNTKRIPNHVAFVSMMTSSISNGEEVFNNYGAKGNENLLGNYGFCLLENPEDYYKLPLNISIKDPLYSLKSQMIRNLNLSLIHLLFDDDEAALSDSLKQVLRIMSCSDPSLLVALGSTNDESHSMYDFKSKYCPKHEMDALLALHSILKQKHELIQKSDPSQNIDEHILSPTIGLEDVFGHTPDTRTKSTWIQDALVYRKGQLYILNHVLSSLQRDLNVMMRSAACVISLDPKFMTSTSLSESLQALLEIYHESWSMETVTTLLLLFSDYKETLKQHDESNSNEEWIIKIAIRQVSQEEQKEFIEHFELDILPVLQHHEPELYQVLVNNDMSKVLFLEAACVVSIHGIYLKKEQIEDLFLNGNSNSQQVIEFVDIDQNVDTTKNPAAKKIKIDDAYDVSSGFQWFEDESLVVIL